MAAQPDPDILYVEDSDDWARLVGLWLRGQGLSVARARTRQDVERLLQRGLPRCVILDLGLGGEDGLALCKALKRSPAFQSLPVIVFTARASAALDCLRGEALYCVEKGPKAEQELVAVVHSVLRQQDRAQGVIDADGVRLDPRDLTVRHAGEVAARLEPGPFAAFALLVRSAPEPVSTQALYEAFLSKGSYKQRDPELTPGRVLSTYVSTLRASLGRELGARIVSVKNVGYAFTSISN